MTIKPQYLTDEKGKKVAVLLPLDQYKKMLEEIEELENIKAFDKAIKSKQSYIPFNQALAEIESKRKK